MVTLMKFIIVLITLIFIIINILPSISVLKKKDRETLSPFECGFDPLSSPRLSFSIHFFTICLMFLIFDIEIVLILPSPLTSIIIFSKKWMISTMLILSMLILSIIIEWKEGSMNWK